MTSWLYLAALFVAKVFDNALGTAKTILVQRNQCVLAGLALGLSNFIMDWERKTLTITAYAETKSQSRLIDEYIGTSNAKFKRLVQDKRVSKR